jgi:hypothetical protein
MLSEEESKHKLALETLYDDEMARGGDYEFFQIDVHGRCAAC